MASQTVQPSPSTLNSQNFYPATSPTVIALLAIGILSIAIVVVLGWRHVHNQRLGSITAGIGVVEGVPKLWDLWSNKMEREVGGRLGIKLLSTTCTDLYIAMKPIAATVISEYHCDPPVSMTLPLIGQPLVPSNHDVTLQVVLAIAMPSQHSTYHTTGYARDDDGGYSESGRLDYTLGLYRCVWSREKE